MGTLTRESQKRLTCLVARRLIQAENDDATYEDAIIGMATLRYLIERNHHLANVAARIARRWGER